MRVTIAAVVALLVGLILGGYQARSELAEMTAEYEQRDCESNPMPSALVAGILGAGAARNRAESAGETEDPLNEKPVQDLLPSSKNGGSAPVSVQIDADDIPEDIDALADIMTIRAEQSREVLMEHADPTASQLEEFDSAIGEMNDALAQLAIDLANQANTGTASRSTALVLTSDALNIIIDAALS